MPTLMRHRAALLAIAFALNALLVPAQASPDRCIVLAELQADPDTTLGEREFVEVWNCGAAAEPLAGWKVRDAPAASGSMNTFTFPAWSLPANGRVVVWGGGAGDGRGLAWSNPSVWNNAGDAATLIDPSGTVADWLGYGSTSPPANTSATVQAKPGHGQSLQLDGATWTLAAPTPGTAIAASGGGLQVNVTNGAPTPAFGDLPSWVRPGSAASIPIALDDPNGASDIASWTLSSGETVLATGNGVDASATATAPRTGASWQLELQATDHAGLTTAVRATVPLRFSDLLVEMPGNGPLAFPAAAPGTSDLVSTAPALVRNLGSVAQVPHLDVSDFAGPGSFTAAGHLAVGWDDGQGNTTWMPYSGPLMPLPSIAPGASLSVSFRVHLPTPLAAGIYGTSFSVVP